MKKVVVLYVYLLFSIHLFAQPDPANYQSFPQNNINTALVEKSLEQQREIIQTAQKERENLLTFVEWILGVVGVLFTAGGIILAIYNVRSIKGIKEQTEKQAEEIKRKVYSKLAAQLDVGKEALQESIRIKAIEIELMEYPLTILHTNDKERKLAEEMEKVLGNYHFDNIEIVSLSDIKNKEIQDKEVIILFSDPKDELVEKLGDKKCQNVALYGHGDEKGVSRNNLAKYTKCYNCGNSYATLFQNLMSLLHYKRYLNKTQNS